ncbi:MAG: PilW family protein [Candidatus Electrothrix sp. Rat3]|nr:PilW family protein [Candidatus Electrothrix rattekaaiensis]
MQRRKQKENGFTLIEVMVSMVIASFVFAGIYGVYTIQQRSYTVQEQVSEMQQKARAALDYMVRDIRMAGYNDPNGNCTSRDTTDWNNWDASADTFTFVTCVPGETSASTVEYGLYDAYESSGGNDKIINDLYRRVNSGNRQLIAEGIDAIEFLYAVEDDTTDPVSFNTSTSVVGVANIENIRSVRISLLMRSTLPDRKHRDKVQYIPASGATDWELKSKVADQSLLLLPWDNYHRRLLVTTVKMRNMGL